MRLYYVEYTLRGSSQSAMTTYQPSDTTELAQLVERRPFKPTVMGSIPIFSAFGLGFPYGDILSVVGGGVGDGVMETS